MKVSAQTITDEQIRELNGDQWIDGHHRLHWYMWDALFSTSDDLRARGRARCADAWNARLDASSEVTS